MARVAVTAPPVIVERGRSVRAPHPQAERVPVGDARPSRARGAPASRYARTDRIVHALSGGSVPSIDLPIAAIQRDSARHGTRTVATTRPLVRGSSSEARWLCVASPWSRRSVLVRRDRPAAKASFRLVALILAVGRGELVLSPRCDGCAVDGVSGAGRGCRPLQAIVGRPRLAVHRRDALVPELRPIRAPAALATDRARRRDRARGYVAGPPGPHRSRTLASS